MAQSRIRQNFHAENEAEVNKQINMELYASYVYLSMAYYFDRDDVALPGYSKFFKKCSDEEREHAQRLMKFQNDRGGKIVLQDVQKPPKDDWVSGIAALETALELEKAVNESLLRLHGVASSHNDAHMCDFLETHYLNEQVEAIKELGDLITQAKRCGTGLGEYMFDKETMAEKTS